MINLDRCSYCMAVLCYRISLYLFKKTNWYLRIFFCMKLKIYSLMAAFSLLILQSCCNEHDIYYIDSVSGSDSNSGLSPDESWKSFKNVNDIRLNPGDKLLLKRGGVYNGVLELSAKGTQQNRITVGAYGESGKNPCIVGHDTSMYAMRIFNSEYVTVRDLEIVNKGREPLPMRTGLKIECSNYGVSKGITVDNITVRDVNGSRVKELGGGSGILIVNSGDEIKSRFDSLIIENSHILRCERNAMIWSGYYDRNNWFPNKHIIVRNNLIEGVPGDGIVPIGCDSTLIEYNVMRDCPDVLPMTEAAAGFWPWSCDNTVIQYNSVSDHKAPWDAQGFDSDYNCNNTVIQYNYSHDNYGGMVLVCNSGNAGNYSIGNNNSIVRYNISIGDGIRPKETRAGMFSPSIHIAGPVENTLIEKNIIHSNHRGDDSVDRSMIVSDSWDGYADNTTFRKNIFYSADKGDFNLTESTNNVFDSNWFIGEYESYPKDDNACMLSDVYKRQILDCGSNGYTGLQKLMSERNICGMKFFFVDKNKIENFFEEMEGSPVKD